MKIGIIGTGNVGGTLGTRWAKEGHDVVFGSRTPESPKIRSLLKLTDGKARAAGVEEAAASSDIVVLATPWLSVEGVLRTAGNLAGKTLVDCTNPIGEGLGLAVGYDTSGGEQVSRWARGARVVKAFNTTGANNMANPSYRSEPITMFICGDWLAANGLLYSNMHTTAICSPTRSCILTGRNHHSNGVASIMELATGFPGYNCIMPFENGMLSEILKEQGYSTYCIGKWHLTPSEHVSAAGPYDLWPIGRGFERFYGFMGGETNQWYPHTALRPGGAQCWRPTAIVR